MYYYVNTIYPTIQGEGAKTGTPVVLLRLQGCGVGCPFCDTKETWELDVDDALPAKDFPDIPPVVSSKFYRFDEHSLSNLIAHTYPELTWVMITGGEPAAQELPALIQSLHHAKKKVMIETSGTAVAGLYTSTRSWASLFGADSSADWVTVSPKLDMPGQLPIKAQALQAANEIKMVVGKQADIDKLDELIAHYDLFDKLISLQPVSLSDKATKLCIETALQRGWNLSLQTHKLIQIP